MDIKTPCLIALLVLIVVLIIVSTKNNFNVFSDWFFNKPHKLSSHKWHHYFDIYDRYLSRFKGKNPVILEIGVKEGGSIEMWDYYFDGKCTIYGIDINPECKKIEDLFNNVNIVIADQGDRNFWKDFKAKTPKFDIIIDDGGHTMVQQIITFEELYYDHMTPNGVYLCEDTHTSYIPKNYNHEKSITFIEYAKRFIDALHFSHYDVPKKRQEEYLKFKNQTMSVEFHDSIVAFIRGDNSKKAVATIR